MHKYRCTTCRTKWLSAEPLEDEQKYHANEKTDGEEHVVKEVKRLTSQDYAEAWMSDLENENRHSLTDMPDIILGILEEEVWDANIIRRIMKKLYGSGIGV